MSDFHPIKFEDNKLILLDQLRLPREEIYTQFDTLEGVHSAIKNMVVRGAPCIGFTAIYGLAIWLENNKNFDLQAFREACDYLVTARPTAVNLKYEVDRVFEMVSNRIESGVNLAKLIKEFGDEQLLKSEKNNRAMAQFAEKELDSTLGKSKYRILTHCNTGYLACGSIGTALGVVQNLFEQGKLENTWVDETRPYLQGSRLTAFELGKMGAPHKIVVEGAASYLMKNGLVDAIFTGADRIVANGDTANKVGTSTLSVLASYYNIPFYIVAPRSSCDLDSKSGDEIEIEMRDQNEILVYKEHRIAPVDSGALNPSFDITDGKLITGIITEKGIAKGDYLHTLPKVAL